MKPGHIRVFDGLRITTEHVNHLQGAVHSALQEIREIIGAPRVHRGFEVKREGDKRVTIQPGLAFDKLGNRMVFDEPKTLDVTFVPDENTKFICVKYDQIEDGQVEGKYTLIWDSSSIVLRSATPEDTETLIPIAKLVKSENTAFEVVSLISSEQDPASLSVGEDKPSNGGSERNKQTDDSSKSAGDKTSETPSPSDSTTDAAKTKGEDPSPAKGPEISGPNANHWRLQVQQGTLRFPANTEATNSLKTLILEPLQKKVRAGNSTNDSELLIPLAEQAVTVHFPVLGLSCHAIVSAAFNAAKDSIPAERPASWHFNCRTSAHGEVTFDGDQISQFGISTYQQTGNTQPTGWPDSLSELTEVGVAHLPLSIPLDSDASEAARAIFKNLQLRLRIDKSNAEGFGISSCLVWKGGGDPGVLEALQQQDTTFTWEAIIGWKAIGESIMN